MEPERRYSAIDFREEGRVLTGVAMAYGTRAALPWGEETILPGAFGDVGSLDVVLNFQHRRDRPLARTGGGGLELRDSKDALALTAALPRTRDGDDALALAGTVLRGFSIEFQAEAERQEGGLRIIERASLLGIGLVDKPAYTSAVVAAMRAAARRRCRHWL